MEYPRLIEQGAHNYLQEALKICHGNRVQIYSYALNIGVFMLFLAIAGLTLYYCYKRKLTPHELRQKTLKDQDYVLSKIRHYQAEKANLSSAFMERLQNAK
jgi:hypothetical protein